LFHELLDIVTFLIINSSYLASLLRIYQWLHGCPQLDIPAGFKICNSTIVKCKHRPTPPWDLTVALANFSVLSHPVKEEIAALICSECKPFPAIAHYTGSMHIEID